MSKDIKRAVIFLLISIPVVCMGAVLKIMHMPFSALVLLLGLTIQAAVVCFFLYLVFFKKAKKEQAE